MLDWQTITPLLEAKLDPKNVRPPAPGRFGDYIEGWFAIAEANRIFGHGNWSYSVDSLTLLDREQIKVRDRYGKEVEQWRAAYEALVTVTVGDVKRQDVGYGQGQAKVPNIGDALESAGKEAVTDALKRALRTFGYPLGLALYDKSKAHVGVDAPEPPHDPETGEVRDDQPAGMGTDSFSQFMGNVRERAGPNATRDEIAEEYKRAVIEKLEGYASSPKAARYIDLFLSVHEKAIGKLPEKLQGDVWTIAAKTRARAAMGEKYDARDFAPIGTADHVGSEFGLPPNGG